MKRHGLNRWGAWCAGLWLLGLALPAPAALIFNTNATWKYFKGTVEASSPNTAWRVPAFNDSAWLSGVAAFYYGEPLTGTQLTDMQNGYTCIFMRRTFVVTNIAEVGGLRLFTLCDDGFIAWINGTEVARFNMPAGAVAFNGVASGALEPTGATNILSDPSQYLVLGTNVVAIQGFNVSIGGSSDFVMDAALSSTAPDFVAPTLATVTPTPGTVNSLSQVTVIFSEPVTGVNAADLRVNGAAATGLTGGSDTYTFTFPQPAYGPVQFTWAVNPGIVDFATPANVFNAAAPAASWAYSLVDNTPPTVSSTIPFPNTTVRSLTQLQFQFNEAVTGVDAADLLINGAATASLMAPSPSNYVFQFPSPPVGPVSVAWVGGHGITDLAAAPNNFAGGSWTYALDPDAPLISVRINEFVTANLSGLRDEDNERHDWVELFNTSTSAVSIAGWSLTDDEDQADQWIFPSVSLQPRTYLIVFCSGKDRRPTTPGSRLHTNFKLDASGGYLALYNAESPRQAVSVFAAYPNQRADIGYGYDALEQLRYFPTPTPGTNNSGTTLTGIVADTRFSHDRGFYTNAFSLAITCATPGVTIRWTRDGSLPAVTNGFVYTGSIQVTGTTVIRALAEKSGLLPSDVDAQTYLFLNDVIRQSPTGTAPPGWPATWGGNVVDYGMDPDIVNNATFSNTIRGDLMAIPTFSVVLKLDDMFGTNGIYSNPGGDGLPWERPCSIELIYPDGADGFQINCGIRVRGGFSRSTDNPKHAFRFFFRQEYGKSKLEYPFFGAGGAETFDKFDLRTMQNYSWSFGGDSRMNCLRDVLARDAQLAMSGNATRGDFYHLYINGQYWGLFNSEERPEAAFGESYYGGASEEYDTIKIDPDNGYNVEATDGTLDAWERLWRAGTNGFASDVDYFKVQGLNLDGTLNPAYENLLDLDNLIDYMLIVLYGGNLDAPISNFLGNTSPNNWYGIRNRTGTRGGFRFFEHDSEHTLLDINADRTGPYPAGDPTMSSGFNKSNPQYLWQRLQANAEFRIRVTDRVFKSCSNGGALTPQGALGIFLVRSNEIDRAIVGESARWGDAKVASPYTRATWQSAMLQTASGFISGRTAVFLNQLRADNLYPNINPPTFSNPGGLVAPGFGLTMTNGNGSGTIYYTLDGSDPRARGGGVGATAASYTVGTPVSITGNVFVRARVRSGSTWSAVTEARFFTLQDFAKLLVSEIMYNPPAIGGTGGSAFEFLELKNTGTNTLDLGGLFFSDAINFTFPLGVRLMPGQFFVLVSNPAQFRNKYPAAPTNGVYTGNLNNAGETLSLSHPLGGQIFSFGYKDSGRWPITPDGQGFSLVPRQPNANPAPGNPVNWRASTQPGGSPGADDPAPVVPAVMINEILTHTDLPQVDAIELFNPTDAAVDLSGWFLTDDSGVPRKFRITADPMIAAGGYRVFTETNFNPTPGTNNSFTLSSTGENVYLFSADTNGNLTGYSHGFGFGAAANGVSFGRYVTSVGDEEYPPQISLTLGAANSGPRVGPVVIRGIMYHPPDLEDDVDNQAGEYVELLNLTGSPVALFDAAVPTNTWRMRGGVDFDFPTNMTLPANGKVLLVSFPPADAAALAAFRAAYPSLAALPVAGPFSGKLDNSSESIELQRPDSPNAGSVPYIEVDRVDYKDSAPWPAAADGAGASLDRLDPAAYGNDPINWRSLAPLQIVTPPRNLTVNAGTNVVLSVVAAGTGTLRYQWRFNGSNLAGQTNATLAFVNVQTPDDGAYTVVVRDDTGLIESAPAYLSVSAGPVIIVQPVNTTVVQGGTAIFSVEVTGSLPIGYRWRTNGATMMLPTLNQRIGFLALTNVQPNTPTNITVVVTNGANTLGVLSATAVLTVLADTDGDGLPNAWEMQYGLNPGSAADAALDTDDDGMTNAEEYVAGTDPTDPESYLRVWSIRPGDERAIVAFQAMSNRTYSVETCAGVTGAPWQRLMDVAATRTNRMVTFTNAIPDSAPRFYRLVAPRKP